MRREYLVLFRATQWWVTLDGSRLGPYLSKSVAVDAAIGLAELDFRVGTLARVSVDEPDDGVPVVYDSSQTL
jgi:hypothetical protein